MQLTFNNTAWRSQDMSTEAWFAAAGVRLVADFQIWALQVLPQRFREPIVHVYLTLEESCHAAEEVKRAHLYAQITFGKRIDRTSLHDFVFDGVRLHIVTWLLCMLAELALHRHSLR